MKKIFSSSVIIMIGDVLARLMSILYLIPLARINPDIATLISYLIIPFAFFIVVSNMGINMITSVQIIKYYNIDRNKVKSASIVGTITLMITGFLSTLFMYFGAGMIVQNYLVNGVNNPIYYDMVNATKIMSIGIIIYSILSITRTILMSMGEYKIISFGFFFEQVVKVFFVVFFAYYFLVKLDFSYENIVYIVAIGTIISMLSILAINIIKIIRKKYYDIYLKGEVTITFVAFKSLLVASLIYIASSFYVSAFDMIDMMEMSNILVHTGASYDYIQNVSREYFGYSIKIIMIPIQLTGNFTMVMIRELNSSVNKKHQFNQIINIIVILSCISIGGILVVGPDLFYILSGTNTIGLMKLQAFIIVFYTSKNILSAYIITFENYAKILVVSTVVIISSKILFLMILQEQLGAYVFSTSSILALILGLISMVYLSREKLEFDMKILVKNIKDIIKIIVVTVFFYELVQLNYVANLNVFIRLIMIGILMIMTYIIVLVDIKDIKKLVKKVKF